MSQAEPVGRGAGRRRDGRPPLRLVARGGQPRTRLATSRVARAALIVSGVFAAIALGSIVAWSAGSLSERQTVFPLILCLGGSVLAGTLASAGWMHSQCRQDGGIDRTGIRLSGLAGLLAILTLVFVTFGLDRIDSEHEVGTAVPPQERVEG